MTILCPIDFSAASEAVVTYSVALAAGTGAQLRLVHVREPQPRSVAAPADEVALTGHMTRYQNAAQTAGVQVTTAVLSGNAAREIVAEARRFPADIIVIGAHGQTGLTRFLMGSTAETVVRTATCVTMLVTPGCPQVLRQSA